MTQPRNRGHGAGVGLYRQQGLKVMFESASTDGARLGMNPGIDHATGHPRQDLSNLQYAHSIYGCGPQSLPLIDPKILTSFTSYYSKQKAKIQMQQPPQF